MKVRKGFVSNSSSSSFILLVGDPKECSTCNVKFDLLNIVEYYQAYSDSQIVLSGIDEFEEEIKKIKYHYKYYSGFNKTEFENSFEYPRVVILEEAIEKAKLNKDKILVEIEIGYHDELVNSVLKHLIDCGQVTVISKGEA